MLAMSNINKIFNFPVFAISVLFSVSCLISANAFATEKLDNETAMLLAKQNGCLQCHLVEKRKKGPAWRDIAAKFKKHDRTFAVKNLIFHITSGEFATFPDGHQEKHKIMKNKDVEIQTQLIEWVLELPGGQWPEAE